MPRVAHPKVQWLVPRTAGGRSCGDALAGDSAFEFDQIAEDRPIALTYRLASRRGSEVDG